MGKKCRLGTLYGFITIIALVTACGGIGTAAETGGWIADNIFKTTTQNGVMYGIYDNDASTVHVFQTWFADGWDVDTIEAFAQTTIDGMFGESLDGYKATSVQLAVISGNEVFLFSKKAGTKQIDLSVHCLLIGACNEMSTKEWEAKNVFTHTHDSDQGTPYSHTMILDSGTSASRDLIRPFYVRSVDDFKKGVQSMSDGNMGNINDGGYKTIWIQASAEYEGEILLFSQKMGESEIFLSIPSQVGFSATVGLPQPEPASTPFEGNSVFETCKRSLDTRLCGHLEEIKGNYPDLTTCLDYCMYETLRIPQTWPEYEKCLLLGCKALHDSADKVLLKGNFRKDLEYIWENLYGI